MSASQVISITALEDKGLTYQWFSNKGQNKHVGLVLWNEILKIDVFKRDMVIYDLICMTVYTLNQGTLEIDEDDALWQSLLTQLVEQLESVVPWSHWFQKVAFPAFETKLTTLYTKQN